MLITLQYQQKFLENYMQAAKDKGFDFLDAPISGGQAGAEGGILTVMVGGDEDVFKKAEPVIDCYSRKVKLIGEIRKWTIN